jgi:alpha-glucosidase
MEAIQRYENLLSKDQWPCYVLGNHDLTRPASRYAKKENDERLKVAAAMLLTLRGTPFIYYGDEIGQRDIPIKKKEDVLDPIGKSFWPFFKGRDGCRAPMQWDASLNAGFSSAKPWLPVHPDFTTRSVAAQSLAPDSLLNFYKTLLHLRKDIPALHRGDFKFVNSNPRFILAYQRKTQEETCLVLLNFSNYERELELENFDPLNWDVLLTNHTSHSLRYHSGILSLHANQAVILKKK